MNCAIWFLLACADTTPVVTPVWHEETIACVDDVYEWTPGDTDIAAVLVHIAEPRDGGDYDAWLNAAVLTDGTASWPCAYEDGRMTVLYAVVE